MKKQNNTSPKGYLSWSQMNLWEKDPNIYYQVYMEGLDQFRTKYLDLGKRLATGLENGFDEANDPIFEMVITFMPPYPQREFKVEEEFEGIPLVGIFDGWDENNFILGEYKSGKNWTQKMVDNLGQLTFYTLLIWLKYKRFPEKIYLHWAKTIENDEGVLELTGDIKTFITKRSMKDIILFSKRIKNVWQGVCELGKFNKK